MIAVGPRALGLSETVVTTEAHVPSLLAEDMNEGLPRTRAAPISPDRMIAPVTVPPKTVQLPKTWHPAVIVATNRLEQRPRARVEDDLILLLRGGSLGRLSCPSLHLLDLHRIKPRIPTMVGSFRLLILCLLGREV